MWYEKLDYKVDIDRLRKEIIDNVFTLGKEKMQGEKYENEEYKGFGGYSLQTLTGDWQDGWEVFHTGDKETTEVMFPNGGVNYKALKYLGVAHSFEHNKPTQACVGYIKEVLDDLENMGFYPRRARVSCLKAHCKSTVHRDSNGEQYFVRIHIPIITNKKCTHAAEGTTLHMPADGSVYIMWVNNWHQIRNDSDEDRYHIIMDAWDTKGVTQQFKYGGDPDYLKREAEDFRKNVDAAVLTEQDIELFKKLEAKHMLNRYKI